MSALAGIVLAAGRGVRMGGPKALLALGGVTLVERHIQRLLEVGCGRVVVIVRPDVAGLLATLGRGQVSLLAAETAAPSETLAVGVRALGGLTSAVVTPVDLLPPPAAVYGALLGALAEGASAATPTHGGRDGHPVALAGSALAPYLKSAPILRDVLRSLRDRRRVEVGTPSVLGDWDEPADVLAASGRAPVFVQSPSWS